MENQECESRLGTSKRILEIFGDFLTRVAKLEEMGIAGVRLLTGFQQALEFLRRPPIDSKVDVIERIIKVNETKWLRSYLEAGCIKTHDSTQNTRQLRETIGGMACLLEDATLTIEAANSTPVSDKGYVDGLDQRAAAYEVDSTLLDPQETEITDYAVLMGLIYSKEKQDYLMQERIINSLDLKTTTGELESYRLMWTLRPFIDDEIMQRAWKLIPVRPV